MMKRRALLIFAAAVCLLWLQFPGNGAYADDTVNANENVFGYGILRRLPGLWHGPVSTTTPAGNFDNWYVDFRPVSSGQVSQYSALDADTINYLTFFIVSARPKTS